MNDLVKETMDDLQECVAQLQTLLAGAMETETRKPVFTLTYDERVEQGLLGC